MTARVVVTAGLVAALLTSALACEPPPAVRSPEWVPPPAALDVPPVPAPALPEGPDKMIVIGRCTMCHDESYLAQQRLTPPQWQKTVDKMRTFGSPMSDDEVARIATYLARNFPADLPDVRPALVDKPTATYRYR